MTERRAEPKDAPVLRRMLVAVQNEVAGVHPRVHAYNIASSLLPTRGSSEVRARLLRLAGFDIGKNTAIHGALKLTGARGLVKRLSIGQDCSIENGCLLELSDNLTLGNGVTLEQGVMILTSTHELDFPSHRAGKLVFNPVVVGDGAWLRARCIILPGVRIGEGAVVEAGAVVNKNVEPNTRVGGSPAVVLETLGSK